MARIVILSVIMLNVVMLNMVALMKLRPASDDALTYGLGRRRSALFEPPSNSPSCSSTLTLQTRLSMAS
jgi:hypothetical protein